MKTYTDFEIIDDDRVLVTFSNGKTKLLGIHHWNKDKHTILCDDFETFLEGVMLWDTIEC